ncbi:MAG: NADH oxidase [Candidatus Entotheonella factor]|uniref:NADH oxidase n=1 Tax=Entotheonella factor TaxID=1429438 RepID=W4L9Z5_ENTF1|nr:MAG: NADH oxidase [Candidatus Entotheonella factor]
MTPTQTLQLHSTVHEDSTVTLALVEVDLPAPGADDVVVRMEAAPINPSDLGVMFARADMSTVVSDASVATHAVRATLSPEVMQGATGRIGLAIPAGNEGGGVVVAAGTSDAAQALLGKVVGIRGGAMYAQYRCIAAQDCLVLPEGTAPVDAASCFVNPLTALGMVETMRMEGHTGLVHTAAASNLGQMLQKICTADGIPLVNIVRKPEQADLMRGLGAAHVCDTSQPAFMEDLTTALAETGATLGFDATGGGALTSHILAAMESAANRDAKTFSRYGSTVHKQVYVYGSLEDGPTLLHRTYGMSWGVGGWLLTNFLRDIPPATADRLKNRVATEIKTTFASHYTKVVSLSGALNPDEIAQYSKRATGQKYLIDPTRA